MLTVAFDELIRYTSAEREKWRGWFARHAAAIDAPVQPGGRLPTVGKLIDHIFLVEQRHLQRLTGVPLSESTGLSGSNAFVGNANACNGSPGMCCPAAGMCGRCTP